MEMKRDNKHILFLALMGILAFTIAGVVNGLILTQFELPLGSIVEGTIWGLILGFFVPDRFKIWKVVIAAIIATFISYFLGSFIGLSLPVPRYISYMIMGIVMGLIFGGIIGKLRGAILFATIGAVVFLIGGFLYDYLPIYGSSFMNFFEDTFGPNGWVIFAPAFIGIFKGLAMGLALGILEKRKI
ncbi:hypothetical protein [Jeotgalibaca sp. A122]|uniref:hypothetical protein n=1 Tax=Jeotgalibaca sp. A122 TaxID=3457322 RepID=UPI003FD0C0CB